PIEGFGSRRRHRRSETRSPRQHQRYPLYQCHAGERERVVLPSFPCLPPFAGDRESACHFPRHPTLTLIWEGGRELDREFATGTIATFDFTEHRQVRRQIAD